MFKVDITLIIEKFASFWNVCDFEFSDALDLGGLRQAVQLQVPLHRHVPAQVTELDLYQFLGVEGTVPVPASSHRLGQHYPCRVHSLEQTLAIHTPSDLPAVRFLVIHHKVSFAIHF